MDRGRYSNEWSSPYRRFSPGNYRGQESWREPSSSPRNPGRFYNNNFRGGRRGRFHHNQEGRNFNINAYVHDSMLEDPWAVLEGREVTTLSNVKKVSGDISITSALEDPWEELEKKIRTESQQ